MGLVDYVDTNSFLNRTDPRVKIIILIVYSVIIFLMNNLLSTLLMFLLCFTVWNVCKMPWSDIKGILKVVTVTMIIIAVMQCFFYYSSTPVDLGFTQLSRYDFMFGLHVPDDAKFAAGFGPKWQGLVFGVLLIIRLLALMTMMPMIIKTTRLDDLSLGFMGLGLPYKIAYLATTAINMVPTFSDEVHVIMDAQKMRGQTVFEDGKLKDKIKGWTTLIVPLVIGAMRRAQQMGVAMDARAFGASKKRTSIQELHITKRDYFVLIAAILIAAALLVINYKFPYATIKTN